MADIVQSILNRIFLEEARRAGIDLDVYLRQNQWIYAVFALVITFFLILVWRRLYFLYSYKPKRGRKK